MADVTFCPFKEKRYFVFFVIKRLALPSRGASACAARRPGDNDHATIVCDAWQAGARPAATGASTAGVHFFPVPPE